MEDKNKEVQLTDEEIEDVSGGFIGHLGPDVGQARPDRRGAAEESLGQGGGPNPISQILKKRL